MNDMTVNVILHSLKKVETNSTFLVYSMSHLNFSKNTIDIYPAQQDNFEISLS